ncbi:MAG TPA: M42 family metallopeptidase [Bacillota bacterium]
MPDRDAVDLIRALTEPIGVPGMEDEVRRAVADLVRPYADDLRVDALGNLMATRRGRSPFRLMLDAHMDEVGFVVSYIEEGGFLRLAPLGGWDARIIPSHLATVVADDGTRVPGVIGTAPPHILDPDDRKKPYRLEDLFVDIGARSAEDVAARGIRIGSPAVIAYPFVELGGRRIAARALDDRAGCAALVALLMRLARTDEPPPVTLVLNFAVAEEIGLRGAQTAAYQIEPDLALAVETTVAADVPGLPPARQPTRVGGGPALTVVDRSLVADPVLVRSLAAVAGEAGIPFQYKLPVFGGTDAGAIQRSRGGVPAAVVSIPARYIHAPYSVLDLDDFERTVDLLAAFVQRCPPPEFAQRAGGSPSRRPGSGPEPRRPRGRRGAGPGRTNKSERFRRMYDEGKSVAEIARETGSPYSFVWGVIQRYRRSQDRET